MVANQGKGFDVREVGIAYLSFTNSADGCAVGVSDDVGILWVEQAFVHADTIDCAADPVVCKTVITERAAEAVGISPSPFKA